jgi:hypothetical protein
MDSAPLPYTYSGVLDDVVQRYHGGNELDQDFFNRMIAKSIFFSGGFLLNDGYLVNHPVARRQFMREDSTLRVMMRTANFVRVLSRENSPEALADMPLKMAKQDNASFKALVGSNEWNELQPCLASVAMALFRSSNIVPWPKKAMHVGFVKLLEPVLTRSPKELSLHAASDISMPELAQVFRDMHPEAGGPRDKFEKAARLVCQKLRDPQGAMRELMSIANQCYHYNFGMCLGPECPWPISVDTQIGNAFDEYLSADTQFDDDFKSILAKIPVVRVPKRLPFERGGVFADLLDSGTEIGGAKNRYVRALDAIFVSKRDEVQKNLVAAEDAAREYEKRIAEHFGAAMGGGFWERGFDSALAIATGLIAAVALPVGALVGFAGGVAISIAGNEIAREPKEFLLRRIRQRQVANALDRSVAPLDPSRYYVSQLSEIRPMFASMAFDRAAASRFVATVPPLNG